MRNKILKLIRWILLPVAPILGWFILNIMYNSTCAYMGDVPGELSLTFVVKLFMDGAIVPMSAFLIAPNGKKIAASIIGTAYFMVFLCICLLIYTKQPLGVALFLKVICFFIGNIGGIVYAIKADVKQEDKKVPTVPSNGL